MTAAARHDPNLGARVVGAFATTGALVAVLAAWAVLRLQGGEALAAAVLGGVGLAAAWLTGRWVHRALAQPLGPVAQAVERLAAGDLSEVIPPDAGAGLQPLVRALADVQQRLFGVVSQVRTGTGNVALNAAQITRDNDALAARTGSQAQSLAHTSASTEQVATAVRQNAELAAQAHALVRTAADQASHGGAVMRDVVETMGAIRASSQGIHDIIGVIDAIAFQTNLLALNAAVEAARAGDQGRGFAVVAAEVRTLAGRCAEAAREVRALVGRSVEQVDAGGERVDRAGQATAAIEQAVVQLAGLIEQIDGAGREQSSGIGIIQQGVASIDDVTRRNAALVQDAARTANALQERAAKLSTAVDMFRLGAREHGSPEDAMRLVRSACDYLQAHGVDALVEDINRLDEGRFIERDLYLLVQRLDDGVFVAHGNNPGRIGTGPEVKDIDGKHFASEFARVAREAGEGWVDYKWVHPVTGQVYPKSGYVLRVDDLLVGCAVYK